MKKLLLLIFPLFVLLLMQPVFAGSISKQGSAPTISAVVEQAPANTGFFQKVANLAARPLKKAGDMDLDLLGFIIGLLIPVVTMWKLFTKAGIAGWWSLIPIANIIMFLKMIGKAWYNIFLLFIPIVNIIFLFLWDMKLAEVFGKEKLFGIGLFFLFNIFGGLLAWDKNVSYKK